MRNRAPTGTRPAGLSAADARRYGKTVARLKAQLQRLAATKLAASIPLGYPALATDRYLSPAGLSPALDVSERAGVRALVRLIHREQAGRCAARPVLLAGYSQGAEVVSRALQAVPSADREHVAVALLGDPSFLPHRRGDYPQATAGSGLRPTFVGGAAYRVPAAMLARTIDVCATGDPVCAVDPTLHSLGAKISWVFGHFEVHDHAYAFSGRWTQIAARFLWRHAQR